MRKISPFLWFDDQAEEAASFYAAAFGNSGIDTVARYGDSGPGPKGRAMTVGFRLEGQGFTALNGGPLFKFTPAISFFVSCETREELDARWAKLSDGGTVLMELQEYPFSKRFGWVADRFGLSWQFSLEGGRTSIAPFLMFVGPRAGKAEEAMLHYASIFKNSKIGRLERYASGEGGSPGTLKRAGFSLDGASFLAIDSEGPHDFTFTPAISFVVNCETQSEIDELWERLSQGGSPGRCGWLEDRYGISWQIVPSSMGELMSDPDPASSGRVMQAMLTMDKLDIAALRKARAGQA